MEQSDGYKLVLEKIRTLSASQALMTEDACETLEQEIEGMIIMIAKIVMNEQDHFAKCMNALAARKASLLQEVAQLVGNKSTYHIIEYYSYIHIQNQEKNMKDSQVKLSTSLDVCQQTLKSGALIYPLDENTADAIWKVYLFPS
jgi:hypothetical protein